MKTCEGPWQGEFIRANLVDADARRIKLQGQSRRRFLWADMSSQFQPVFARLRDILEQHAEGFLVGHDTHDHYGLEALVGPATVRAWGGKVKSPTIPVAWVKTGKTYVSYHLMGVYGNPKLLEGYSDELRAHMQGKSCFNFKATDETLFQELDRLTAESLDGMRKAGYIST